MLDVQIDNTSSFPDEETIRKNIIFFCSTPKGSIPQMRGYGFDFSIIDEPIEKFRIRATVDIITGVRNYYGINIKNINITSDETGNVSIRITI